LTRLQVAEKLAKDFMSIYIPEWKFTWNDAKTTIGHCTHNDKTITLSETFTKHRTPGETLDTILHEIAHALVGPGKGHGDVWKAKAVEIGAKPTSCSTEEETQLTPEQLKAKFVMLNPEGKVIQTWVRKPMPKTFNTLAYRYETGRKYETMGKLRILTMEEYQKENKG